MKSPLVSIIVPAWNIGENIQNIVNSIINQPFGDFELIIIDDGSSDNTLSILKGLEKIDSRIKVFTKINGGPSSARNIGLEYANGKYIQFYDSDDNIPKNAMKITTSAIKKTSSDMLVSGWQIDLQSPKGLIENYKQIKPKEETINKDTTKYTLRSLGSIGTLYNLWNKLFRADIIRKYNLRFREDLYFGEDLLFSLDYIKHINSLSVIPDITYNYLTNSKTSVFSLSSINPNYRKINDEAIIAFAGPNPTDVEYDLSQWLRWRWLMSYWSQVAVSKISYREKLQLIREFKPTNLSVIKTPKNIGWKKYIIQLIASMARLSAFTSLLPGQLFQVLKKAIMFVKLNLRK